MLDFFCIFAEEMDAIVFVCMYALVFNISVR